MKNFFLKNPARALIGVGLVLALSLVALTAFAATPHPPGAGPVPQTTINDVAGIYALINTIFGILFWLLIVLASVFIIWAAFLYLTAGGDPEKIKTANKIVIYAAVAVVVAVLAKAIPTVVCSFVSNGCAFDPGTL